VLVVIASSSNHLYISTEKAVCQVANLYFGKVFLWGVLVRFSIVFKNCDSLVIWSGTKQKKIVFKNYSFLADKKRERLSPPSVF
jgi:hypothetical protein